MQREPETSAASTPQSVADPVAEADLERVLDDVPKGTFALGGAALAIMLAAWLFMYFGVFLARGVVG
jgi:hypothetical protein